MHPTADTLLVKFLHGVARRVMPGVRFLLHYGIPEFVYAAAAGSERSTMKAPPAASRTAWPRVKLMAEGIVEDEGGLAGTGRREVG
jgi:hypothetical protein